MLHQLQYNLVAKIHNGPWLMIVAIDKPICFFKHCLHDISYTIQVLNLF